MTGREMVSLLRTRLRELCPAEFSEAYLVQELNAAQTAVVAKTRCLVDSATITTIAGTQKYAVPLDSLRVLAAEYDGQRLAEHAISTILDSEAASGAPYAFGVFADELWLYPTPDAAKTLRTYYVRRPAALAASALDTTSDLPDEWAEAAVTLALANVLLTKGDQNAQVYFSRFEQTCAERAPNTRRRMPDRMGLVRRR